MHIAPIYWNSLYILTYYEFFTVLINAREGAGPVLVPYMFGQSFGPHIATLSMWFLSLAFPFGPFTFNPSGFECTKLIDDW